MNRRDFIRSSLIAASALTAGTASAGMYGSKKNEAVNRLSNRENPTVLEKKHVPAVMAPQEVTSGEWFTVTVDVGFAAKHPSTPGHWITMIKLLLDGQEIGKTTYEKGGMSDSKAVFTIRLDRASKLEAVENCNLHGTWISDPFEVKVRS